MSKNNTQKFLQYSHFPQKLNNETRIESEYDQPVHKRVSRQLLGLAHDPAAKKTILITNSLTTP